MAATFPAAAIALNIIGRQSTFLRFFSEPTVSLKREGTVQFVAVREKLLQAATSSASRIANSVAEARKGMAKQQKGMINFLLIS